MPAHCRARALGPCCCCSVAASLPRGSSMGACATMMTRALCPRRRRRARACARGVVARGALGPRYRRAGALYLVAWVLWAYTLVVRRVHGVVVARVHKRGDVHDRGPSSSRVGGGAGIVSCLIVESRRYTSGLAGGCFSELTGSTTRTLQETRMMTSARDA